MYWPVGVTNVLFADGDTVRKASRLEQSATKTIARYGFVGHLWPTNCSCHRDRNQLARDRPLADSNANSQTRTCQRSLLGDSPSLILIRILILILIPIVGGNYPLFLLPLRPFSSGVRNVCNISTKTSKWHDYHLATLFIFSRTR